MLPVLNGYWVGHSVCTLCTQYYIRKDAWLPWMKSSRVCATQPPCEPSDLNSRWFLSLWFLALDENTRTPCRISNRCLYQSFLQFKYLKGSSLCCEMFIFWFFFLLIIHLLSITLPSYCTTVQIILNRLLYSLNWNITVHLVNRPGSVIFSLIFIMSWPICSCNSFFGSSIYFI